MIDNYQDLLAQCADAAETAATAVLYSALEGCSDEVLQDLLEEVQDGYTFEDSYSMSRIAQDELELRKAKKLVAANA